MTFQPKTFLVKNGIIYLKLPTVFSVIPAFGGIDSCIVESDGNLLIVSTCSGFSSSGTCKTITVTSISFATSTCILGIKYTATSPIDGVNNEKILLKINNFYGPVKYTDISGFLVNTVEIQGSSEYAVDKSDNIP